MRNRDLPSRKRLSIHRAGNASNASTGSEKSPLPASAGMFQAQLNRLAKHPFVAVVLIVLGLIAGATRAVTSVSDAAGGIFNSLLGLGSCFERDPSDEHFSSRGLRRVCEPGMASLVTWSEVPAKAVVQKSYPFLTEKRALQLTGQKFEGRSVFVEYYLYEMDETGRKQWKPAHTWNAFHPRAAQGWNSLAEGLVVQRFDDNVSVCQTGTDTPLALEILIPSDADSGCPAYFWGDNNAYAWRVAAWWIHFTSGRQCNANNSRLHLRWKVAEKRPWMRCSGDLANHALYRQETSELRWEPGPPIVIERRD
jgi:hypothetical protein